MFGRRGTSTDGKPFYIYYGPGTAEASAALRRENLVIVEPRQWTKDGLAGLQAGGTRVYGYWSVMETPVWNEERIRRLSAQDYWTSDGARTHFETWNSDLMDIRSPSYRMVLLQELEQMLSMRSLDGLLLDTVGDIEEYLPAAVQPEAIRAYRALLAVVRSRYPGLRLVQNRGFTALEPCSGLLDGLLWEDWRAEWTSQTWAKSRIDRVRRWMKERKGTVYACSAPGDSRNGQAAQRLGFLHRDLDPEYVALPRT